MTEQNGMIKKQVVPEKFYNYLAGAIIVAFLCLMASPYILKIRHDFGYEELLIVEEIAPSNWVVEPLVSGDREDDAFYDVYYAHHVQILDNRWVVLEGYIALNTDDVRSYRNYPNFRFYDYLSDGPAPAGLTPSIKYAEQWDIGCEVIAVRDVERCDYTAEYEETVFHVRLETEESIRFSDLPEIMEQIVAVIEAQDRHIGEMMGIDS